MPTSYPVKTDTIGNLICTLIEASPMHIDLDVMVAATLWHDPDSGINNRPGSAMVYVDQYRGAVKKEKGIETAYR